MKKIISISFFFSIMILQGCDFLFSPSGLTPEMSSEAAILAFSIEGIVGESEIDVETKLINVTVLPMDLAGVEPMVEVSEGAKLLVTSQLVDGESISYIVAAEDGRQEEWSINITVQYGIAFTLGEAKIILTSGIIDSTDPATSTAFGNGIPGFSVYNTPVMFNSAHCFIFACAATMDISSIGEFQPYIHAGAVGITEGTYSGSIYYVQDADGPNESPVYESEIDGMIFTIETFGPIGSDISGRFIGTVQCDDEANTSYSINPRPLQGSPVVPTFPTLNANSTK